MISYKKMFHILVWFLFISFLVLYFAQAGGYYENLNNKKATLTEEKIKEFEEDVKNGEEIRVENYVVNMEKDYSNNVSDFGSYTSRVFAKYFKVVMEGIFGNIEE